MDLNAIPLLPHTQPGVQHTSPLTGKVSITSDAQAASSQRTGVLVCLVSHPLLHCTRPFCRVQGLRAAADNVLSRAPVLCFLVEQLPLHPRWFRGGPDAALVRGRALSSAAADPKDGHETLAGSRRVFLRLDLGRAGQAGRFFPKPQALRTQAGAFLHPPFPPHRD